MFARFDALQLRTWNDFTMTLPPRPSAAADENPFFEAWNTPFGVPPFGRINAGHFLPAYRARLRRA